MQLTRIPWPATGFVCIDQILGPGRPIPLSKSTWYDGIKEGKFPKSVKIGGRTVWRVKDIDDLIARLEREGGDGHRSRRLPPPLRRFADQPAE
jgi:hypothetical protein